MTTLPTSLIVYRPRPSSSPNLPGPRDTSTLVSGYTSLKLNLVPIAVSGTTPGSAVVSRCASSRRVQLIHVYICRWAGSGGCRFVGVGRGKSERLWKALER